MNYFKLLVFIASYDIAKTIVLAIAANYFQKTEKGRQETIRQMGVKIEKLTQRRDELLKNIGQ